MPTKSTAKKSPSSQEKKPASGKKSPPKSARPIVYEKRSMQVYEGEKSLTAAAAKKLLGWTELKDDEEAEFTLVDNNEKKIVCCNNLGNRPFDRNLCKTWESEILLGNWRLNGETIIIGSTGQVLSGQHRLISLVLAVQEWEKEKAGWPHWKTAPVLPCYIAFGIDETDEVVNTIDTGKPRTLADVIYRSELFVGMKNYERVKVARIASHAVKFLSHRVGAFTDAFSPKRTHAESLEFLSRHNRLLDCVRHIFEEDAGGDINKYLSNGYAAAMMYLMACSKSDPTKYREDPSEKKLDWSLWEKAAAFWVEFAGQEKKFEALRTVFGKFFNDGGPSPAEACGVFVKAWNQYAHRHAIATSDLKLKYAQDDEIKYLAECPTVGGIDLGDPEEAETEADVAEVEETDEDWKVGDKVFVFEAKGGHWRGEIEKLAAPNAEIKVGEKQAGAGTIEKVKISQLRRKQPKDE